VTPGVAEVQPAPVGTDAPHRDAVPTALVPARSEGTVT
jgi:hypothetical protein